jgi:hypothetical protein
VGDAVKASWGGVLLRFVSAQWNWSCRCPVIVGFSFVIALFTGCTRAELEHKADAYNQAIAESNNRQILLNAVRASQRAPMSFVGFGDVSATPSWAGSASSTFNFDPFGLTTYNLNPTVSVAGGFSSFTMNNLNNSEFAHKLEQYIPPAILNYFVALHFPKELVQLIFIQEYKLSTRLRHKIEVDVSVRCANQHDPRTEQFCDQLNRDRADFITAGCRPFSETSETITILNTARDRCSMTTFQIFERQLRLLNLELPALPATITATIRTGQGVLYFLGELIAAQNYSTHPYMPMFFTYEDGQRRNIPVFEVRRGIPIDGQAAVVVSYDGDIFYIPKPELGSVTEARSLQVLDLVTQIITLATSKDALPKTSTVTLVPVR